MSYSLARSPLRLPGSADIYIYIYIYTYIHTSLHYRTTRYVMYIVWYLSSTLYMILLFRYIRYIWYIIYIYISTYIYNIHTYYIYMCIIIIYIYTHTVYIVYMHIWSHKTYDCPQSPDPSAILALLGIICSPVQWAAGMGILWQFPD